MASLAVSEPSVPTTMRPNIHPPVSKAAWLGIWLRARPVVERRHHNRPRAAPANAAVLDRDAGRDRNLRSDLSSDRDREADLSDGSPPLAGQESYGPSLPELVGPWLRRASL